MGIVLSHQFWNIILTWPSCVCEMDNLYMTFFCVPSMCCWFRCPTVSERDLSGHFRDSLVRWRSFKTIGLRAAGNDGQISCTILHRVHLTIHENTACQHFKILQALQHWVLYFSLGLVVIFPNLLWSLHSLNSNRRKSHDNPLSQGEEWGQPPIQITRPWQLPEHRTRCPLREASARDRPGSQSKSWTNSCFGRSKFGVILRLLSTFLTVKQSGSSLESCSEK